MIYKISRLSGRMDAAKLASGQLSVDENVINFKGAVLLCVNAGRSRVWERGKECLFRISWAILISDDGQVVVGKDLHNTYCEITT